jgi:hypothetical protein
MPQRFKKPRKVARGFRDAFKTEKGFKEGFLKIAKVRVFKKGFGVTRPPQEK